VKEYSLNGRLEKLANYKNGILDGTYTEYKFGKLLLETYYEDGNLDGEKRIYFDANEYRGRIQQKIRYKDGVKHGLHQYYNENGEVVLEYKYENGQRVEE
jgi:antitoxin component YwqK of YwqJK toxin-antitoxin module